MCSSSVLWKMPPMARLTHAQSLLNGILIVQERRSTHDRACASAVLCSQKQRPCRWNASSAFARLGGAHGDDGKRRRALSKSERRALTRRTGDDDLAAFNAVPLGSRTPVRKNVDRDREWSSWSLKSDESGIFSPANLNSDPEAADEAGWDVEASRSSSEGLATDFSGYSSLYCVDTEQERDNSLDSSEGLTTDRRRKERASRSFAQHLERQRQISRDSIEGVTGAENDSEWKNVFPSYMRSRESDADQDPSECPDEAALDVPNREPRNPKAKKAAIAAVASAEEYDSQFGSRLISSVSPPAPSNREKADAARLQMNDLISHDPIWAAIRAEARLEAEREPLLSSFLYASILAHPCFERSLGFVLANRLKNATLLATQLLDVFDDILMHDPYIRQAIRLDVQAVKDRDPSCGSYSLALLYLKGYHAIQAYRVAHALWNRGQKVLAFALQSRISEVLAVDIHPAARLGKGILLDHGTGVVIGETAVVGNRVSMLQGVTLGGTGKAAGDRHPKIKEGVLLGAGATILGNIVVGRGAMVAAGSLVLKDVPPHSMVAGTPARVIGYLDESIPSLTMEQDAAKNFCQEVQRHVLLEEGAGI